MPCMHCQNPPCVAVCPTGASYKRSDGIVAVDYESAWVVVTARPRARTARAPSLTRFGGTFQGLTPYEQVMYAKHQVGVEEKCNFCMDRIAQGEQPACVATCPSYARVFGDLSDPNSEVSQLIAQRHGYQLLPELGTDPSVYYLPA
jgi:Fe-S-cluster-containing dehydrogenase component